MVKKFKKVVFFFEVEILDAKTREKLCFLDKVASWCWLYGVRGVGSGFIFFGGFCFEGEGSVFLIGIMMFYFCFSGV